MIQSVRPDGTFEFVNRAWEEKLGYKADELDGMTIWDIIHPEEKDHCSVLFMKAMQGETLEDVRTTFQRQGWQRGAGRRQCDIAIYRRTDCGHARFFS